MKFEMFEMLQYIDSSIADEPGFYKTLPAMTETDVRKVYMMLKRTKSQNTSSSSNEPKLSCST